MLYNAQKHGIFAITLLLGPTVYFYQTEDLRGSYIQLGEIFHRYGTIRQACFSIKP